MLPLKLKLTLKLDFFFLHDNLTSLANNNDIKFEACKFSLQQNSTLEVFYAHIAKLIAREEVETC